MDRKPFDLEFYKKNTAFLSWALNTFRSLRKRFGIPKSSDIVVTQVYANGFGFWDKNKGKEYRRFYGPDTSSMAIKNTEVFNALYSLAHWYDMNIANPQHTLADLFNSSKLPHFDLDSFNVYLSEEWGVDGEASSTNSAGTSAAVHRANAGGGSNDSSTVMRSLLQGSAFGPGDYWQVFYRTFLQFNTTGLQDFSGSIDEVSVSVYLSSKTNTVGFTDANAGQALCNGTTASKTAIVNSDYGSAGVTPYASSKLYSELTAGAYNDFILNAAGIAAIDVSGSKDAITPLCMRNFADLNNSIGTGGSYNTLSVGANWSTANYDPDGTDRNPYLQFATPAAAGGDNPDLFSLPNVLAMGDLI